MNGEAPALGANDRGDRVAVRGEATDIIVAEPLGLADAHHDRRIDVEKLGMTGEGECLLDRIGDHQEVPAGAAGCDIVDPRREHVGLHEEIADKHGAHARRQRAGRRQVVARAALVEHQRLGEALDDGAGGERSRQSEQPDALAAAHQQVGGGESEHDRTVELRLQRQARRVGHRIGAVDPDPDGVRRFPFALAHVEPVVAGGAAPVDTARGFSGDEGAELPKILAGAGAAAPVHAVHRRRGDLLRGDDQRR